jgi:hypothetical protein
VLSFIVLACFFGPYAFPFTGEDADFDAINQGVDFTWPISSGPTTSGATSWSARWKAGRSR